MEQRIQAATARQAKPGTSVVYWFANSEQPYVAGGHGAPGIISRALGLTNVYADHTQEWPQVGWADFAAKDPDVIVIGDLTRRSQTAETVVATGPPHQVLAPRLVEEVYGVEVVVDRADHGLSVRYLAPSVSW